MTHDSDESETDDRNADRDGRPITVRHNWEQSGEPSVSIVEAVAAATDRPTTELPPLRKHVNPEAIDALLTHESVSPVDINFTYVDSMISVSKSGDIEIHVAEPPEETQSDE